MTMLDSSAWLHLFKAHLCLSFSVWGPLGEENIHTPNAVPVVDAVISEEKWSKPKVQLLWLAGSREKLPWEQWKPVYCVNLGWVTVPHFSAPTPLLLQPQKMLKLFNSNDTFPDPSCSAPDIALINIWKLQQKPTWRFSSDGTAGKYRSMLFEVPGGGRWEMMRFGDSLYEQFVMHIGGRVTWWQIHFLVLNLN